MIMCAPKPIQMRMRQEKRERERRAHHKGTERAERVCIPKFIHRITLLKVSALVIMKCSVLHKIRPTHARNNWIARAPPPTNGWFQSPNHFVLGFNLPKPAPLQRDVFCLLTCRSNCVKTKNCVMLWVQTFTNPSDFDIWSTFLLNERATIRYLFLNSAYL
jgi:hypothetical protein